MTDETPITPAPEPTPEPTPVVPTPEPTPITPNAEPEPVPVPTPAPAVVDPMLQTMSSGELAGTILGAIFFTLAVPLVLWIVWNQSHPAKAKQAIKIFWIIIIVEVLLVCCVFALYASVIGAAISGAVNGSMYY